MSEETKLIQQKGSFTIRGIIEGKDNPAKNNGYTEGIVDKGDSKGKKYKAIKFKLKTSNENIIVVELFGMEKQFAYMCKEKAKGEKATPIEWNKRESYPIPKGYNLIVPEYDFVENINQNFKDGDSVVVVGEFQFSTYTNEQGVELKQIKYVIKKIFPSTKELNFDDVEFEEMNEFKQEIVINEVETDLQEKKLYVHAYIIGYKGKYYQYTFEVDTEKSNPDFVKKVKTLKFGDALEIKGKIHFKVVIEDIDGEYGKDTIKSVKKCLEITSINKDSVEKAKYKENDFVAIAKADKADKAEVIDWSKVTSTEDSELPFNLD